MWKQLQVCHIRATTIRHSGSIQPSDKGKGNGCIFWNLSSTFHWLNYHSGSWNGTWTHGAGTQYSSHLLQYNQAPCRVPPSPPTRSLAGSLQAIPTRSLAWSLQAIPTRLKFVAANAFHTIWAYSRFINTSQVKKDNKKSHATKRIPKCRHFASQTKSLMKEGRKCFI